MIQSSNLNILYQVTFSNGRHTSAADVSKEKGGQGQGFGPHELLEAALATCMTITVQMSAAKHNFPLKHVTTEVRIDRSQPSEVILNYKLTLDGPLSTKQREHLTSVASRCPVLRTLTGKLACHAVDGSV